VWKLIAKLLSTENNHDSFTAERPRQQRTLQSRLNHWMTWKRGNTLIWVPYCAECRLHSCSEPKTKSAKPKASKAYALLSCSHVNFVVGLTLRQSSNSGNAPKKGKTSTAGYVIHCMSCPDVVLSCCHHPPRNGSDLVCHSSLPRTQRRHPEHSVLSSRTQNRTQTIAQLHYSSNMLTLVHLTQKRRLRYLQKALWSYVRQRICPWKACAHYCSPGFAGARRWGICIKANGCREWGHIGQHYQCLSPFPVSAILLNCPLSNV
jgi:hypothetical protein